MTYLRVINSKETVRDIGYLLKRFLSTAYLKQVSWLERYTLTDNHIILYS